MKKIIFILFAFCLALVISGKMRDGLLEAKSKAGNFSQGDSNIARHMDNLYDIVFVDENNGWAAGYYGTIFHTNDGGKSWQVQESHTDYILTAISFIGNKVGWIVGREGTILHTEDGGSNWMRQEIEADNYWLDISFVNELQGWVTGDYGAIFHTGDGGKSWTRQLSYQKSVEIPEDIFSPGEWQTMARGAKPQDVTMFGIDFIDESRGWAVGEFSTLFYTEDGGKTWVRQELSEEEITLQCIDFVDEKNGWIAGIEGTIFHTGDGGKTWELQDSKVKTFLLKINFFNKLRGCAVGLRGTAIFTVDGGISWRSVVPEKERYYNWFQGISFASEDSLWISGERGTLIKGLIKNDGNIEIRKIK